MTEPRIIRGLTDTDRALQDLARDQRALAGMTGADSARIDTLVKEVGTMGGNVEAVRQKVDGVAEGVNELRDALTVLVRHDVQMQNHAAQSDAMKRDVIGLGERVQTLEKQIGPVIEMRTWVIALCLGAAGLIVSKLIGLLS